MDCLRNRETELRPMQQASVETAAIYQYLLNLYPGKCRDRIQQLFEGEMETVACLKGVAVLWGQSPGKMRFPPAPREPSRKLLEKAYYCTGRAAGNYGARAGEPEVGRIFQKLGEQAENRCLILAEILGRI